MIGLRYSSTNVSPTIFNEVTNELGMESTSPVGDVQPYIVPNNLAIDIPNVMPLIEQREDFLLKMIAKLAQDDCQIRHRKYERFRAHNEAEKLAQTVLGMHHEHVGLCLCLIKG